jgi:hypothetical protein
MSCLSASLVVGSAFSSWAYLVGIPSALAPDFSRSSLRIRDPGRLLVLSESPICYVRGELLETFKININCKVLKKSRLQDPK